MRDLLDCETQDARAAETVTLFCYEVKKWIGAFAGALGGLDTLAFACGIGKDAPRVRARICDGLGFLGIELDEKQNVANEGIISANASRVAVCVIRTEEERMLAQTVCRVLCLGLAIWAPVQARSAEPAEGKDMTEAKMMGRRQEMKEQK